MQKSVQKILDSKDFKQLMSKRATVSTILMVLLFAIYYGYIFLIGLNKQFLTQKIGEVTPLGIPLGVAVILAAWVLTVIYVVWANATYDPEVKRLKGQLLSK
ncbi:MAG: DUF485 domain-containing protein [Deltaproteobacteria bacterium]|nr:DUF485 domain-containing protein [Deltaproteobacteria bacterium]